VQKRILLFVVFARAGGKAESNPSGCLVPAESFFWEGDKTAFIGSLELDT